MEGIIKRLEALIPYSELMKKLKESKRQKQEQEKKQAEDAELIFRLKETQKRLKALKNAYELEIDFALLDAYIMEINGLEKQYSLLFAQAKKQRVTAYSAGF